MGCLSQIIIERFSNSFVFLTGKAKEEKTLDSIGNARKRVSEEITQVKERLKRHKNAIETLKEAIHKMEEGKPGGS